MDIIRPPLEVLSTDHIDDVEVSKTILDKEVEESKQDDIFTQAELPKISRHGEDIPILHETITKCNMANMSLNYQNSTKNVKPSLFVYNGKDLSNWQTTLGDGVYALPNQLPVDTSDIETEHLGEYSVLRANVQGRRIMAHNITYKSLSCNEAFNHIHTIGYSFRLPYMPSTEACLCNGQTFEGGFFIWDGANTRLDYGIAFQWMLNPWLSSLGTIQLWMDDGESQFWAPAGRLKPDMEWHSLQISFSNCENIKRLIIDSVSYPSVLTKNPKSSEWGSGVDARLQAEVINLWPGDAECIGLQLVEVKDWFWIWE